MDWFKPKSPIKMDNSTAVGVTIKTIVSSRSKIMDMSFWWLRCRASQDLFRYYRDAGSKNWTNCQPDTYHEAHPGTHAGIWEWIGTWPICRPTMGPRFSPTGFPFLFFPFAKFCFYLEDYFPTFGCCQKGVLIPWWPSMDRPTITRLKYSPTPRICLTRAIVALTNNLGIDNH